MNRSILFFAVATVVLPAALYLWLPFAGGKGRYFTMQLKPEFLATGRADRIRRSYTALVLAIAAFALVAGLFLDARGGLGEAILPFVEVAGFTAAWAWGWNRVLPQRVPHAVVRTASLTPGEESKLSFLGAVAALLPLIGAGAYLAAHYQSLPARFAVHFDATGLADHIADRTFSSVYDPLIVGFVAVCLMTGLLYLLPRYTPGMEGKPALMIIVRRTLIAAAWFVSSLVSASALLPFAADPRPYVRTLAAASLGGGALFVAFLAVTLARYKSLLPIQNSTSEDYWKAGLIYYNPNDAALFVPKRLGIGYTLNFARPLAWVLMVAVLGISLVPLAFLRHH